MPTRLVRDSILTSSRVNSLSTEAELFYRRLMSVVDDYGRYEADLRLLLSRCYPLTFDRHSPSFVGQMLAECGQSGLVRTYEHLGKKYLEINNFGQRKRTPSKYPPSNDGQMTADCGQMTALGVGVGVGVGVGDAEANLPEGTDAWEWFEENFHGEIEADAYQEFIAKVNTPEKFAAMLKHLPLWMKTSKFENGHGKTARWFIKDELWLKAPNEKLMGKQSKSEDFWERV